VSRKTNAMIVAKNPKFGILIIEIEIVQTIAWIIAKLCAQIVMPKKLEKPKIKNLSCLKY